MAVVTSVRARGESVVVELDGAPWRTLPVGAVVEAGLAPGVTLDRARTRVLAQSLRRLEAERVALRTLARREHSRASLAERLERAGVGDRERREVLERAGRSRLVDDERFARGRALALAARGNGDALILDDLRRNGIVDDLARDAVGELDVERARAERVVAVRGASARTARWLAARGFADEIVAELVADVES